MRSSNARAFTLLEVVVVLALLGLVLGVSIVAVASLRPPQRTAALARLDSARTLAISGGVPVTITDSHPVIPHSGLPTHWLFLPDGRAVGPGLDPVTAQVLDAK